MPESLSSRTAAYSAKEPREIPNTSSPFVKPGHRRSHRSDGAGDIEAGHRVLRRPEPETKNPHEVRPTSHEVPGPPVETGRVDMDENHVRSDAGYVSWTIARMVVIVEASSLVMVFPFLC